MKILDRRKLDNVIRLFAGDSLVLTHNETKHTANGTMTTELARTVITATQAMVVDEAVLFETAFEGRRALGGLVVEQQS